MKGNTTHVVGITGASGAIIGVRLIEELLKSHCNVTAVVTDAGWETISCEILNNKKVSSIEELLEVRSFFAGIHNLKEYKNSDFFSPIASGTAKFDSVTIAPCSMKTLSAVANGYSDNLLQRAVDVALKENRKTILVTRETPLSLIHLENMVKAKRAGAVILPPVPGFYNKPATVDDIVNYVVGKILNLLNIEHSLIKGWGENAAD